MVIAYIQDLLISNNDINYAQAAGKYFRFMNGLMLSKMYSLSS